MKFTSIIILMILTVILLPVNGQLKMKIHKKDNSVLAIPVSEIDRITYEGSERSGSNGVQLRGDPANSVRDIDDNVYRTVRIGSQIWMAEDLKTKRLNDGTVMYHLKDLDDWSDTSDPAYVWYDNIQGGPGNEFGILYNGYAVETEKLCPDGWRVPTKDDWETLVNYCGSTADAGGKLKEQGTYHWRSPNKGSSKDIGFKALPNGMRSRGKFSFRSQRGVWWTSTRQTVRNLVTVAMYYNMESAIRANAPKNDGICVRCIKSEF